MFRVVPDQLRISDGWVRCGQCDEVFDANVHLQTDNFLSPTIATASNPISTLPEPESLFEITHGVANDTFVADAFFTNLLPKASDEEALGAGHNVIMEGQPADLAHVLAAQLDSAGAQQLQEPVANASAQEPSFMHRERVITTPSNSLFQLILGGLCILMGLALFFQVVVHERNRLVANLPQLKASFVHLCAVMSCDVGPLHLIESVVIESSSFTKIRSEVYQVKLTLKNIARVDIGVPAVELTLTDLQDKVIVRRVFGSEQIAPELQRMSFGADVTVSLPMVMRPLDGSERVSGYRLLAFYP